MSLSDWLMITSIILLIVLTVYGVILLKRINNQINKVNEEVKEQIKLTKKIIR